MALSRMIRPSCTTGSWRKLTEQIQLFRTLVERIPRQRWNSGSRVFKELLKQTRRSWRFYFHWTVDEEVDLRSLLKPLANALNPLLQIRPVKLTIWVADKTDQTEWGRD